MQKKFRQNLKAFTLLEVLIATAIFAVVMVMTSGIVAQSSGFQTKINVQKDAGEQTRWMADLISNDVRSAGKNLVIQVTSGAFATYPSGVALFKCDKRPPLDKCTAVFDTSPTNPPTDIAAYSGNTLVVRDKTSGAWIYYFDTRTKKAYRGQTSSSAVLMTQIILNIAVDRNKLFDDSKFAPILSFGGFSPTSPSATGTIKQQSYVLFNIDVKTKNFGSLSPAKRAETSIRSMVTSRNYNN